MNTVKRILYFYLIMVFLGAGLCLLLPFPVEAGKGKAIDLQLILDKLEDMSRRINALEKRDAKISPKSSPEVAREVENLKENFTDIASRLDKVELKSILDKIQMGGEIRFRNDFLQMKDKKTSKTTRSDNNWSTRFRLNLKADITDNIKFHSRLTSFKMWGDSTSEEMFEGVRMDMNMGRLPTTDGNLHVEQAYIDYFLDNFPLSFTLGRFCTTDGPPVDLQDNITRKATFPSLLVNAEMDAIILTLGLEQWTGLKGSTLRPYYAKAFQDTASVVTEFDLDDTTAMGIMFETPIPGIKKSLFQMNYTRAFDIPSIRNLPAPALVIRDQVKSVGDLDLIVGHLQLNDIKKSGIDCFLSLAYSHTNPFSHGTRLITGQELGLLGDNINGGLGKSRSGHAIFTGLRYTIPCDLMKNPKVGFEYNYGSKYWVGMFTGGSDDPLHKLMVNGDGIDFYYIQPLHSKHAFMRFGCTQVTHDYSPDFGPYGARESVDREMRSFYGLMDIRF